MPGNPSQCLHQPSNPKTSPSKPHFANSRMWATTRSLLDRRVIAFETGVASLENGNARAPSVYPEVKVPCAPFLGLSHQFSPLRSFAKACKVSSPATHPHLPSASSNDLFYNPKAALNQYLSPPSLRPENLGIIPRRKPWYSTQTW